VTSKSRADQPKANDLGANQISAEGRQVHGVKLGGPTRARPAIVPTEIARKSARTLGCRIATCCCHGVDSARDQDIARPSALASRAGCSRTPDGRRRASLLAAAE
jgi:hypothetical protein